MKSFIAGFAACYILIGLAGGLAMKALIPALNPLGVAYIAATYPVSIVCTAAKASCSNVPEPEQAQWMFTFDGE